MKNKSDYTGIIALMVSFLAIVLAIALGKKKESK